jgi:ABC-type transport system involved in cytochrome c biogenesis permease subunit
LELSNNWIRIFVSIGIISGGVWANEAWGSYWSWDPKRNLGINYMVSFRYLFTCRITKFGKVKDSYFGGLGFFVIGFVI